MQDGNQRHMGGAIFQRRYRGGLFDTVEYKKGDNHMNSKGIHLEVLHEGAH